MSHIQYRPGEIPMTYPGNMNFATINDQISALKYHYMLYKSRISNIKLSKSGPMIIALSLS